MAALVIIQKVANVPPSKRKLQTLLLLLARCTVSMRCIIRGRSHAVRFHRDLPWLDTYGLVSPRFELKNKHG